MDYPPEFKVIGFIWENKELKPKTNHRPTLPGIHRRLFGRMTA